MDTIKKISAFFSVALLISISQQVSAFSVWAVEGGASSTTNQSGSVLNVSPGSQAIDLYFETEGDISWGWDITLEVAGAGLISSLSGGDINGGFGVPVINGFQQLGGDASVDLIDGPFLLFSFVYDSSVGSVISLTDESSYTSGTDFTSNAIGSTDLVLTAVPLPGAIWLMFSGLVALVGAKKFN
jgi:hypothetical protein